MSSLFRPEVLESKRDTWLGHAQDIQPIPIRIISIVAFVLTIALAVFLYYGSYTRRVHVTGNVTPVSGLVTIGSRVNGIIIQKNIKEGQSVKKGDVLFIIDLDSISVHGPSQVHVNDLLKKQQDILKQQIVIKQTKSVIEKNNIKNTLLNLKKQHNKVTDQIEKDNEIIPLIKQSLLMIEKAKKLSLATNQEYQSQLFSYAQILSTHAQFLQNQSSLEGQLLENVSKLNLFDSNKQNDINELEKQIFQIQQQIIEAEKQRVIYITSPIDGKIAALRGYVGQQVNTNTSLVSIIQNNDRLGIDFYVPSSSIGFLQKGQSVVLRYTAFPYQKFGLAKGVITEVTLSPITSKADGKEGTSDQLNMEFSDRNKSTVDQNLYRIRVSPKKDYIMSRGKKYYLQPGMKVDADIAVDNRRLYEWMLQPVTEINDTIKTRLTQQKP